MPPSIVGGHSDADAIGSSAAPPLTVWHAENSDVLPSAAVAVAVIASPLATGAVRVVPVSIRPMPWPSVVVLTKPSQRAPSPLPLASQVALA